MSSFCFFVAGNIYGDSKTFSAGKQNAAGVDVSADTVFRLASMTKIMGVCGVHETVRSLASVPAFPPAKGSTCCHCRPPSP